MYPAVFALSLSKAVTVYRIRRACRTDVEDLLLGHRQRWTFPTMVSVVEHLFLFILLRKLCKVCVQIFLYWRDNDIAVAPCHP